MANQQELFIRKKFKDIYLKNILIFSNANVHCITVTTKTNKLKFNFIYSTGNTLITKKSGCYIVNVKKLKNVNVLVVVNVFKMFLYPTLHTYIF